MESVLGFFENNRRPPGDRGNGNGNGDDYKRQIESQLSRLMSNKIPMDQIKNYKTKNDSIIIGLNEIVNIIDESKQHFGVFQRKIGTLKQKNGSGEKMMKEADRLIGQQERVGELCVEENRKIQECENEKTRLQSELSSKLEDVVGKKDEVIASLRTQIEELDKRQRESITTINSANEELINYNQSLVDKIKKIADSQGEIINELSANLGDGTEVESKINTVKEKLIDLVDSIDDENNKMGTPLVHRNGRLQQPNPNPLGPIIGEPIANPAQGQRDVLAQQFSRGAPVYGNLAYRRGGKHKKTRKGSKKGGKGKKHMKMLKTRSRK